MNLKQELNLQLFADAGTLVNASGNYVNAYSGETSAFPDGGGMTASMKTFYDTELLENAILCTRCIAPSSTFCPRRAQPPLIRAALAPARAQISSHCCAGSHTSPADGGQCVWNSTSWQREWKGSRSSYTRFCRRAF